METSGSVPRETKFKEGKEQSNDNHPSRNREMTERNVQSSSTRNQHNEKMKLVEDSSDSETDYENQMLKPSEPSEFMEDETSVIITDKTDKDGTSLTITHTTRKDGTVVYNVVSKTRGTRGDKFSRGFGSAPEYPLVAKSSLKDIFKDEVRVAKHVPPPPPPPVAPM